MPTQRMQALTGKAMSGVSVRVRRIVLADIEAHNLGAAQTSGIPKEQDRPVAQAPQVVGQGGCHRKNVFCQDCFLLNRWTRMPAPDACQHRRDVPVHAIE